MRSPGGPRPPAPKCCGQVADQFYGERTVSVQDPFGHIWHFRTVKETLTVEEMMKRMPK